jgi:hypothetical protein
MAHHVRVTFALGLLGGCGEELCLVIYLTHQFDNFLFAQVNEGSEATPLSVLSMLARLNIDPWDEAAKLARLPRSVAAGRLVDFIAATPGASSPYLNAAAVSERLTDLLPAPVISAGLTRQGGLLDLFKKYRAVAWLVIIAALVAIILMAASQ